MQKLSGEPMMKDWVSGTSKVQTFCAASGKYIINGNERVKKCSKLGAGDVWVLKTAPCMTLLLPQSLWNWEWGREPQKRKKIKILWLSTLLFKWRWVWRRLLSHFFFLTFELFQWANWTDLHNPKMWHIKTTLDTVNNLCTDKNKYQQKSHFNEQNDWGCSVGNSYTLLASNYGPWNPPKNNNPKIRWISVRLQIEPGKRIKHSNLLAFFKHAFIRKGERKKSTETDKKT